MLLSKSTIFLGTVSLLFSVQTANASILDFSDLYTPDESIVIDINNLDNLAWRDDSASGGHIYLQNPYSSLEASLPFTSPHNVISLDLHGHFKSILPNETYTASWESEDLTIRAFGSGSTLLWEQTYDLRNYNDDTMSNWLPVDIGVSNVDYLTFTASKLSLPSIDNLNIEPVPIPGAVWLLGSGLLGMVAIRRKSNK